MRIGQGYDVHKLVSGRKLILAGVEVPFEKGLLGHSDADVLTHAIIDSLLGAAALGDIGALFPDTDNSYKNADSCDLLKVVCKKVKDSGFNIINIDATLIAQRPKIKEYINIMRENISKSCNINKFQISIKATTSEKMGFEGREEGMTAIAVSLLDNNN